MKLLNKYLLLTITALSLALQSEGQRYIQALDKDGDILMDAMVEMQWSDLEAKNYFTNGDGKIILDKNTEGVFYLKCYGYKTILDTIKVGENAKTITLETLSFHTPVVTVTCGSKDEKEVESVHKVRVIYGKYLEETGRLNLKDALQNETNLQFGEDNVLGSSISMQGISGQGVKILLDGVPLIGRLNGNVDLSQIDVTNIERIEIIEGPMSVLYGTDALGGVINIITKTPKTGNTDFNIGTYNDNFEQHNVTGNLNSSLSKTIKVGFSGGRKFFRGHDFNDSTRSVDWKPKTQYFGDANLFLNFKKHNHRIRTRMYEDKITVRSDANFEVYTITGFNAYYYTSRNDFEQFSTFDLKNNAKIRVQNAYNLYKRRKDEYRRDLVTGQEVQMPDEYLDTMRFTQYQSKVYYFTNNTKKINFMAGLEHTLFMGDGTRMEDGNQKAVETALFGSAVYKIGRLKLNPGLRIMHQSQFGEEIGSTGIKLAPLIPSFHAKYSLKKNAEWRLSMAKGYRSPSLKELYFYFVDRNHNIRGNESLVPEQSFHADVFWTKRKCIGKDKLLRFNAGAFFNDVQEKIQLVAIGGFDNEYSYANLGNIQTVGGQIGLGYKTKRWNAQLDLTSNGLKPINDDIHWNNQAILTLTYTERFSKVKFSYSNKWNGKSYGFNDDLTMYEVESYFLSDISLSKNFFQSRIRFTTGVKNIFNVTNLRSSGGSTGGHSSELGNIPMGLGRTFYFSINFALNYDKEARKAVKNDKN